MQHIFECDIIIVAGFFAAGRGGGDAQLLIHLELGDCLTVGIDLLSWLIIPQYKKQTNKLSKICYQNVTVLTKPLAL